MIGQESIKSKLLNFSNVTSLPNSMLFIGDIGCGKHTLASELANHYGLPLLDITTKVSHESIEEIYLSPLHAFYLINVDEISERQQNALLKFVEEPLLNSHIILLTTSKRKTLDTIVNRCVSYEFKPYSKEELTQFIKEGDVDEILSLCTTPGQIINLNVKALEGIHTLCDKMIKFMGTVNYPNALVIAQKINYKDEYDKYDFNIFLNCYKQHLLNDYLNTNSKLSFDLYNIVVEESKLLEISNINKGYFMECLLTKIWERCRNATK